MLRALLPLQRVMSKWLRDNYFVDINSKIGLCKGKASILCVDLGKGKRV